MNERHRDLRIAVDIGGTFTDCVVLLADGLTITAKALTTLADPSAGVVDCLDEAASQMGCSTRELASRTATFVHGTTVATNALTTRRGARTGLLMTRGHEHSILIGRVRQKVTGLSEREKTHVTQLTKADPPIVLPEDIRPVTERIDARSRIIVALDMTDAERAIDSLVASGVEALAVCFLWSFLDPRNEERVRDLAQRKYPDLFVSISSEIAPRVGEYERCVSTVFNSYIGRVVGEYLARLEERLGDLGLQSAPMIMQANGGLTTVAAVRRRPLVIVDSGPAGGVLGSRHFSGLIGQDNILCADVGGTTFDVGLVFSKQLQMDSMPVIDRYSYVMPKIYVKSIGAGGGSVAWVDPSGSLRVGPQSAGSQPGPVAYGLGGSEPTVTDAHVVLGYLDPDFQLGGRVRLDKGAAGAALSRLGERIGLSAEEAAAGILRISNAQMADLARKVTLERGLDPRTFVLFAYGGAGPVFGAFLAKELGARMAYIPAESGVFSAFGMLATDIVFQEERSVTYQTPIGETAAAEITHTFETLGQQVRRRVEAAGLDPSEVRLQRAVDMRFRMQVHELDVDVRDGPLSSEDCKWVSAEFIEKYERTYGKDSAYTAAGIDYVTLRVIATVAMERPALDRDAERGIAPTSLIATRKAFFSPMGFVDTSIHAGAAVRPGQVLVGPAIVRRKADTVVLPPGSRANVDSFGGFTVTHSQESGA